MVRENVFKKLVQILCKLELSKLLETILVCAQNRSV